MVIEGEGEGFRVRDEGSRNGTFVNNTMIKSTILCSGDIIRAGRSLFQVQLRHEPELRELSHSVSEDEQENELCIPNRTIESSVTELNSHYDKPNGEHSEFHDEETLLTSKGVSTLAALLLKEFSAEASKPWIWRQNDECDLERWSTLLSSIVRFGVHVHFIINRSQNNFSALSQQGQSAEGTVFWQLSPTLWMIRSSDPLLISKVFLECWSRDSVVIIGTSNELETTWLEDSLDVLSYPSLLMNVLSESESRSQQVSQKIQFLLFEWAPDSRLRLLLGGKLRDTIASIKSSNHEIRSDG